MKFFASLFVLALAALCAVAMPAEKDLKGSEQVYLASPYSAYPYAAAAVPAAVPAYYSGAAYAAYPAAYPTAYSGYSYYYK